MEILKRLHGDPAASAESPGSRNTRLILSALVLMDQHGKNKR